MKTQKLQSLENFKKEEVNSFKIKGGSVQPVEFIVVNTGPGKMWSKDQHYDYDGDGTWEMSIYYY